MSIGKKTIAWCSLKMEEREKLNLLVVAHPSHLTGGGIRALRSLREYSKHFNTFLFIPWGSWGNKKTLQKSLDHLNELKRSGIKIVGFSSLPSMILKSQEVFKTRMFIELFPYIFPGSQRIEVAEGKYDAVMVLNEPWDSVYSGKILAESFNIPSAVLLQLPPFYGSRDRFSNIMKSRLMWRELISNKTVEKILYEGEALFKSSLEERLAKIRYKKALRKYDIVLGVSKSIAVEMGGEWLEKVRYLNPGVSLDKEDIDTIEKVRKKIRKKEDYIVLGGRVDVGKGLVDALIALKLISRRFPGIKLIVTGNVDKMALFNIKKICKKLNIEDKVIFTGFVPREKRFEIVAGARLMIYPSHVDSFPYAVLESLNLGTPVVAYRIPAIEINYGNVPGVEMVEEMDVEALSIKAINMLEKGTEAVEAPKMKSWDEIMSEELNIVRELLAK
jgi:glycosyltransferase involved in cell wall biosynthesis